jgi:hypothetical protein
MPLALLLVATACHRDASAQVARDPLGPIRCFEIVDARQVAMSNAIQLCAGALSDAPGRCYSEAGDRFHELSSAQVQQLCTGATSTEPVRCYAELRARGTYTEDQMITYCATRCALAPPPPQVSDPACLNQALARTNLTLQAAGQLCLGASSTGPVECFVAGQRIHKLSDSALIFMCAEATGCQYYNAP